MTFKAAVWRPVVAVLNVVNLVALGYAAGSGEPWHAAVHAGLALALGAWAQRLSRAPAALPKPEGRMEQLATEVDQLRGELAEAQERLDFTERMLAREPSPRRADDQPH